MAASVEELAGEIIKTDVLIIGGGLAGAMAAIRLKERNNIDVVMVEKAAIERSGDGGIGRDHYPNVAHPRINGYDAEDYGRLRTADYGGLVSTKLSIITCKGGIKPLAVLEKIGVKVREEDGTFKMVPGRIGGGSTGEKKDEKRAGDMILYRGADLKIKLAAEVLRRGVRIFERTMLTNLITKDGSVVGAMAVNVRNGKFLVFKAKATLLATGSMAARMSPVNPYAPFPINLFIAWMSPANAGGGAAAAYRAGAKLTNMEFNYVYVIAGGLPWHQGLSWSGSMVNSRGENLFKKYPEVRERYKTGAFFPPANFAYMPDMSRPEVGRDVLWCHSTKFPEEHEWYGSWMSANSAPIELKLMRERGGVRKAPYEMLPWVFGPPRSFSGVMHDEMGETSLKGLFVAGDVAGGMAPYGSSGAFAWGYRIGDYLRENTPDAKVPVFSGEQVRQVQVERERVLAILGRKGGADPLELEDLVRKIVTHYVGLNKIEPRLKRSVELIKVLRDRFVPTLKASNPHQLMRAIEVQNIIDLLELHAQAALIRTETRLPPAHYREDYPEQDDIHWKKNIVLRDGAGEMKHTLETLD